MSSLAAHHGYVLVTPVRNEEATIGITIAAVLAQTIRPRQWVIVSDESTDRTDEIVAGYAAANPFIRPLRLRDRPPRNFASIVFVVESGLTHLTVRDYSFIGLLDADIRMAADYFEKLLAAFQADPALGLAGGLAVDVGTRPSFLRLHDVAGAVQFFRRECFEAIGKLFPIPEGGWDALTNVCARMRGYKTATLPHLVVDHLKPRNISEGGLMRRAWQLGLRDYALGYHPLYVTAKNLLRIAEPPLLVGTLARFMGYASGWWRGQPRVLPQDVLRDLRREQLRRLCGWAMSPAFPGCQPK